MNPIANVAKSPWTSALGILLAVGAVWSEFLPAKYHEPIHRTEQILATAGFLVSRDPGQDKSGE